MIRLLASLDRSGTVGHEAVSYVQMHGIHVGIRAQSAGARWTPWNRIEIHPRYTERPAGAPYALILVVHEVRHLQQGWMTALSVYGELDAWQCQFGFLQSLPGRHEEATDRDCIIHKLMALPLGWDREVLRTARDLMVAQNRLTMLPIGASWDDVVRVVAASPFSRLPVYRGSPDEIVGMLRVKDLVERYVAEGPLPLDRLLRPVVRVVEDLPADRVVTELRERRAHSGIVVDAAGRAIGLITMQDLLGELLGQGTLQPAGTGRTE